MTRRLAVVALALACAFATPALARHRHRHHNDTPAGAKIITCNHLGCSDLRAARPAARPVRTGQRHHRARYMARAAYEGQAAVFSFHGLSSAAAVAERYVGHTPSVAELKGWARETGIGVWRSGRHVYCALGINKVFAEVGIRGSGSFTASSFRRWGVRTHDPHAGDVAVVGNHHVAIVVGRSPDGVIVVSFNDYKNSILRREYPLRGVEYRTVSSEALAMR